MSDGEGGANLGILRLGVVVCVVAGLLASATPSAEAHTGPDVRSAPIRGSETFPDVEEGHWAEDAIGWAAANGIVSGTEDGNFSPNLVETRAYAVYYLYKLYATEHSVSVARTPSPMSRSGIGQTRRSAGQPPTGSHGAPATTSSHPTAP